MPRAARAGARRGRAVWKSAGRTGGSLRSNRPDCSRRRGCNASEFTTIEQMFLHRLTLKNILSFKETSVEFGRLNVLIGANAAGKSNLIESISLLQDAPTSISKEMLRGGGVRQWLWL